MNPLEQVNAYLTSLERRLRWSAVTRGIAAVLLAAFVATVLLVLYSNSRAFSDASVRLSRFALFLAVASAIGFGLMMPLLRLNRRRAARRAEDRFPAFEQRLVTFIDRPADPFTELLAADTVALTQEARPSSLVHARAVVSSIVAAVVGAGGLMWLLVYAPGFLGYGSSLLWAGVPKSGLLAYYQILVEPGDRKVRRGSDQLVRAQTLGFQAERATLYARYRGTSKWEHVPMQPQPGGSSHEFLFAGLPESVEFYVEANGVRSRTHEFTAIDLPSIRKVRVTYNYPSWTALKTSVEDPGGDLRGVNGTEATIEVLTDRPLTNGSLVLDDNARIALQQKEGNWSTARVHIDHNGMYHVAAIEKNDEAVRLSEDYFIEVENETPPKVHIARPGRDAKVNPLEEVAVAIEAEDDFGLNDLTLHYSVNGGPEKEVPLLKQKGQKQAEGQTTIALEDFKLSPGDLVSMYATARDAKSISKSDMLFVEAQPYEREYTQSQQMGGGGGGAEGGEDSQIAQRQKEIIVATYNQLADRTGNKTSKAENAKYLSDIEGKLRDQAQSLARRMQARELSGSNQEFQSFTKDMDAAASAMAEAVEKLKAQGWKDALPPEQKALQHLQRAEAIRRQIQVAYGRGGEGQGGGNARDLESLFDLELDLDKNQYETGQQQSSGSQQRKLDEALQRLEELARRQQEAAKQAQRQQTPQQKWQQEMLRREAEKLQREMQQLSRGGQGQGQGTDDQRVRQAQEQLSRAMDEMRRGSPDDARRAAERLREATENLRNARREESGNSVDELANRAERLANEQRNFQERAKGQQPGQSSEQLARDKERMAGELDRMERDMQRAARDMQGSQRSAANKLREALGDMQGSEVRVRQKALADWYRRGYGSYVQNREPRVTQDLDKLAQQLREARAAVGPGGGKQEDNKIQQALSQVERLREQLNRAIGRQPNGDQQGRNGQQGNQRGNQPGQQQGNQQGQQQGNQRGQQGRPGNQPGQQPGEQPGGQQQGNQPGNPQQAGMQGNQGQRGQQSGMMGGNSTGQRGYDDIGIYRKPTNFVIPPTINDRASAERAVLDAMRELSRMRSNLQDTPETAQDVQELLRQLQRLNPSGNPLILEHVRNELIPQIEQLETQLRRKLDEAEGGQVRSAATEQVTPAYQDAVAEYFRRLSKGK